MLGGPPQGSAPAWNLVLRRRETSQAPGTGSAPAPPTPAPEAPPPGGTSLCGPLARLGFLSLVYQALVRQLCPGTSSSSSRLRHPLGNEGWGRGPGRGGAPAGSEPGPPAARRPLALSWEGLVSGFCLQSAASGSSQARPCRSSWPPGKAPWNWTVTLPLFFTVERPQAQPAWLRG